jgi:hypothetical protein
MTCAWLHDCSEAEQAYFQRFQSAFLSCLNSLGYEEGVQIAAQCFCPFLLSDVLCLVAIVSRLRPRDRRSPLLPRPADEGARKSGDHVQYITYYIYVYMRASIHITIYIYIL